MFPLPLPLAPEVMVIHGSFEVAVQEQALAAAVMLKLPLFAAGETDVPVTGKLKEHDTPACVMEKVCPATPMLPLRGLVPVFGATE